MTGDAAVWDLDRHTSTHSRNDAMTTHLVVVVLAVVALVL